MCSGTLHAHVEVGLLDEITDVAVVGYVAGC